MAMMFFAYPWLVLLAAGWVTGAIFVGMVGGVTRGVQGFFVWILAGLMFSPLLAMLGLIAAECRPDTQAEAERHGAARLLEKPINPRELRTIVRALRPETAPA